MRRPSVCCSVNIIGVHFESVRQACDMLGMSHANVIGKCRSKDPRFVNWKVVQDTAKRISPIPRPIKVGDTKYSSYSEAAKVLKLPRTTIRYRCIHNQTVDGISYTVVLPRKKT